MKQRRTIPQKGDAEYRRLWRIVDGAVADAFAMHPEYLTKAGRAGARRSIVKRVTGSIYGFASQEASGRGVAAAAESGLALATGELLRSGAQRCVDPVLAGSSGGCSEMGARL